MESMEILCRVCEEAISEFSYCSDCFGGVVLVLLWIGSLVGIGILEPFGFWLFKKFDTFIGWLRDLVRGSRAKAEYYQMKLAQEKAAHPANEEAPNDF